MDDDLMARQLVRAVQEDLRLWLNVPRLEPELIANLYLRIRDILRRDGALDELALAVYLTATAWQPSVPESASVIPTLRRDLETVINAKGENNP